MNAEAPSTSSIAANLRAVRARIDAACKRCGRDPASVGLIVVTKTLTPEAALAAIEAGVTDLGENYVQEGAAKRAALGPAANTATWRLIGHLQTNKVRAAIESFDTLDAVDSVHLAEAIDRRAARRIPVLLEVNAAREPSKFGLAPEDVGAAVAAITRLANVELRGLMTVAPAAGSSVVRSVFRSLRELAQANSLPELSMGMSGDFEVAIEEGSTMVRVGRAIFGERSR